MDKLYKIAVDTLCDLIRTPSLSREETQVADILQKQLRILGFTPEREGNNVWARIDSGKDLPVVLLNSHLDTVKPVEGWTKDPHQPEITEDRIYGLGSNDAGASLCSLMAVFYHLCSHENPGFNLIFAATAEEEISGQNGISSILEKLGKIDLGIVGEPTGMKMAVAEKGLMVMDCTAFGRSSHVSHQPADNAIYNAMKDIEWIRNYSFEKKSEYLGEVQMQVTEISAGYQHNVIPDRCSYILDVRTNDCYSNNEVYEIIISHLKSTVVPRSFRLNSSFIPVSHPLVQKGISEELEYFGSSTLSDQALLPFKTVKIGPGDSTRSHTADEYIMMAEIRDSIEKYIRLLSGLKL